MKEGKVSSEAEEFMPYAKMELRDHVSDMLAELEGIGLGGNDEDEDGFPVEVSGADCVDVMSQYILKLRSAVARDEKAVSFVECIVDCKTPDELWDFVQNNHDKIIDDKDLKVPAPWRRAVISDDWDAIARMASVGFSKTFLKHLVDYMNGLLEVTPSLGALVEMRVPFEGNADDPYPVMVMKVEGKEGLHFGILGIFNGLLESLFGPGIMIAGKYNDGGRLVEFGPYVVPGKAPEMLEKEEVK